MDLKRIIVNDGIDAVISEMSACLLHQGSQHLEVNGALEMLERMVCHGSSCEKNIGYLYLCR
ncbi:unnamed protein product [Urochloa humidicola]